MLPAIDRLSKQRETPLQGTEIRDTQNAPKEPKIASNKTMRASSYTIKALKSSHLKTLFSGHRTLKDDNSRTESIGSSAKSGTRSRNLKEIFQLPSSSTSIPAESHPELSSKRRSGSSRSSGDSSSLWTNDTAIDIKKRREPNVDTGSDGTSVLVVKEPSPPVPPPKDYRASSSIQQIAPTVSSSAPVKEEDTPSPRDQRRERQRSSIQTLVSPSARKTNIRVAQESSLDKDLDIGAFSTSEFKSVREVHTCSIPLQSPIAEDDTAHPYNDGHATTEEVVADLYKVSKNTLTQSRENVESNFGIDPCFSFEQSLSPTPGASASSSGLSVADGAARGLHSDSSQASAGFLSSDRHQVSSPKSSPPTDFRSRHTQPTTPLPPAPSVSKELLPAPLTLPLGQHSSYNNQKELKTRALDTLVSIHTEHAEPTFVSSNDNIHNLRCSQKLSKHSLLSVRNNERLKHYRSESDLKRLQNLCVPSMQESNHESEYTYGSRSLQRTNSTSKYVHGSHGHRLEKKSPQRPLSKETSEQSGMIGFLKTLKRIPSSLSLHKYNPDDENCHDARPDMEAYSCARKRGEGTILRLSEDGHDVLVMEMVSGKLQVVAGTAEKLFLKLADETAQDLDYVDTYIMCHSCFTSSVDLLEDLMARFHLDALGGEQEYFKKWQRCIQVKILNVILRWIKLQYQDFARTPILLTRLEAFLDGDLRRAGFSTEADMTQEALELQMARYARKRHSLVALTCHSLASFGSNGSTSTLSSCSPPTPSSLGSLHFQRNPSPGPSLFSLMSSASSPPSSPTVSSVGPCSTTLSSTSILLTIDVRDIARYLTLADFYIFKCITTYDYLSGHYNRHLCSTKKPDANANHDEYNYIQLMTKRANMLSHWVGHELRSIKVLKQRRNGLRKWIEIAKLCLEWNNFHTSMVITMGLASTSVQKLTEAWHGLSSRDLNTFEALQRNLDLGSNMCAYRQAFRKKAKAPAVPFLPAVLKDLTFYMDGNQTLLSSSPGQPPLINFAKFRSLTKFVTNIINYTNENYWFAGDLEHLAFFPGHGYRPFRAAGPLDRVAETVEHRLRALAECYEDPHCKYSI